MFRRRMVGKKLGTLAHQSQHENALSENTSATVFQINGGKLGALAH